MFIYALKLQQQQQREQPKFVCINIEVRIKHASETNAFHVGCAYATLADATHTHMRI